MTDISADQITPFPQTSHSIVHTHHTMSSKREQYLDHEKTLLASLKLRRPKITWKEITESFNRVMPADRKRTMHGLKYLWKEIKQYYLLPNQAVSTKSLLTTH
jgi:hypothetical protein